MSITNDQSLWKRYSMTIEWSEEDDVYVVTLPEFPNCHTHGSTREEALKNGEEVLELLIESKTEWEHPLPAPRLFQSDEPLDQTQSNSPQADEFHRQKVG